jgi:hypothetical protein
VELVFWAFEYNENEREIEQNKTATKQNRERGKLQKRKDGSRGRARTFNPSVNSRLLYH